MAVIIGVGAILSGVLLFDIYQDWMLEGNRPWTTLAENLIPLVIAMGLVAFGWRGARTWTKAGHGSETATWVLAGTVGTALICAIVLGFQIAQGRIKPAVILTQLTTVGAAAGLLVGRVVARTKRTRRKLRRHRDLLRRTEEVADVGGWEYDPSTDTVKGTDQLNRILGLSEGEEFDLERGFQFYPPGERDTIREKVTRCLEQGVPFDLEVPLIRDDAQRRWVRVRGERQRREDGTFFLTGTLQDITEQKEVEQTLREEQEILRRMYRITADRETSFESKIEALIELGRSYLGLPYGHVTRISEDTQEISYASGGHPLIRPGESCPLSQSYCRKTIKGDGLLSVQNAPEEGWTEDPAYQTFELDAYIGSKIQVGGDIYGTFCFAAEEPRETPFTERERTFVELLTLWTSYEIGRRRATRRLEAQNQSLDRFASVVSHDLRNPLNVAKGRLDLATEALGADPESPDVEKRAGGDGDAAFSDPDTAQAVEHAKAAGRALQRMDEIIEDMLALTWGRREADPEEVEPIDLRRAAERCWRHVGTADASLSVETDLRIEAHEGRLQQLLENLFRNAIEHGGENVTVRIGLLSGGESPEGFFVEDDGPGIPEEKWETVLETGYSTNEEGTGLGLSIVRAVADSHEWTLSVTEGQEGGARFEVRGVRVRDGS